MLFALFAASCESTGIRLLGTSSGDAGCGEGFVDVNDDNGDVGAWGHTWAVDSATDCGAAKITAAMSSNVNLRRQTEINACDFWAGSTTDTDLLIGTKSAPCASAIPMCWIAASSHTVWLSGTPVTDGFVSTPDECNF